MSSTKTPEPRAGQIEESALEIHVDAAAELAGDLLDAVADFLIWAGESKKTDTEGGRP